MKPALMFVVEQDGSEVWLLHIISDVYTAVGKSRFTFVRMGKDLQVVIITIPKIDKS
jgi:hypothetical protein